MATVHSLPHAPRSAAKPRRARRPAAKAAKTAPSSHPLLRLGTPAKAALIAAGTLGLAAIAVAIIGPRRLEREVLAPLQKAVGPQAEKLWDQASPVREQLTGLFRRAGGEREKLVRDFQSWIGHFRAS
jgi:anti-sigma factor RsiW